MTNGKKDSSKDFLRAIFFLVITQHLLSTITLWQEMQIRKV